MFFLVVYFFSVLFVGVSAQSSGCDCFPVNTTSTSLGQLAKHSPLYSIAASTIYLDAKFDTICYSIRPTCTPDNYLVEQAVTLTDWSVSLRAGLQTTLLKGQFVYTNPARIYKDFILSNPCPGVFVIYRCPQTGACVSVTDRSRADVFVVSSRFLGKQELCVQKGLADAKKIFPEVSHFYLPRTSENPCSCQKIRI